MKAIRYLTAVMVAMWAAAAQPAAVSFSASGATAADIQATVNAFRTALGTLNANVVGSFPTGRREINWDGVPDQFSAPNPFPAGFFNSNSPRGVVFSTPGTGFQVSADDSNPTSTPTQFDNIDPTYSSLFATFSPQRLFTALGSTVTDVNFFVPGSTVHAFTSAFGAVFTDVDLANITSLQFFDTSNNSLGTFFVPNATGNETFSFLGVEFDAGEHVSRVRITSGDQLLVAGNTANDLVVMDDFIFAEPQVASEPASLVLLLTALAIFGVRRRVRPPALNS
jgi:hypothetical protein